MPRIDELPFLDVITLGGNGIAIDSLTNAISALHPGSKVVRFTEIKKIRQQLDAKNYSFLVIDLLAAGPGIRQFIAFCKKKYRQLVIIIMGNADDIPLLKDFFKIGINAYISPDVTSYEFGVTLLKTFSGENYVGTTISGKLASTYLITPDHN